MDAMERYYTNDTTGKCLAALADYRHGVPTHLVEGPARRAHDARCRQLKWQHQGDGCRKESILPCLPAIKARATTGCLVQGPRQVGFARIIRRQKSY
jgi:hypothetical protein